MRSALNSEVLAEALGQHAVGSLPTVEELTALIAEVEVAGFQGSYELDDQLLRTAWYLHGIASASEAAELYTPLRQQRAFRVSAHIFDLALNNSDRGTHDRLTLAFAAQVGYRRSKLDPNATSIFRRAAYLLTDDLNKPRNRAEFSEAAETAVSAEKNALNDLTGDLSTQLPLLALRIGVAFLGLDSPQIARLTTLWRRQFDLLAEVLEVQTLTSTMYGPTSELLRAVRDLVSFMRSGDRDRLSTAQSALESVLNLEAGEGDHDARWVAGHLLSIADGLQQSSVWSVLPPGTPSAVAQAFTIGQPSVLTLWPPQQELLAREQGNPLSPQTKRLLLSVPTSAGKTLMAQLMICAHLATERDSVCYVTPLRSLGREMRQALRSRLRVLDRELGAELPDRPTGFDDIFPLEEADVDVMTPERLLHALRRDPTGTLDRYSLFVIDEVQLLAQAGRGFMLESLLTFLRDTDARLVLLSGVLGNAANLANWLSPDASEVLFTSDWRGPRQVHALLYSVPDWGSQVTEPRRSASHPWRMTVPARAVLKIRPAESIVRSLQTPPIGSKVFKATPDKKIAQKDGGTPFYADVAVVASILLRAGSLLMVVSQRDTARKAAQIIARELDPATGIGELELFFEERLGRQHPLLECVRHGVGYHHAGLPTDVLSALEQALRDGQLQAMVATSTLTDGVNLPVRTVVISETTYEGQPAGSRLDPGRLLNAVGRAGRAGRETEGWIVLALNKTFAKPDFEKLIPTDAELELQSTLLDEDSIISLSKTEELMRQTADAIFRMEPGPAADFVSYVWFVLSSLEQVSGVVNTKDLPSAVEGLLGLHQLDPALRERWKELARETTRQFVATDASDRRRWNSAGTTLATAIEVDQIVQDVISALHEAALDPWDILADSNEMSLTLTLKILSSCNVFARLLALPEAKNVWRFRSSPRTQFPAGTVKVDDVILQWVGGAGMSDLAANHLSKVPDVAYRLEQMVDVVSGAFEHFLSWTVGVVVEQTNEALVAEDSWMRLRSNTSSMLRYGVDTSQALALLTGGVQSRRLAHRIGRWAEDNRLDASGLRDALAELHIDGWRDKFGASPPDVLDLLEFTRARRQSLLRALLESGSASVTVNVVGDEVGGNEGFPDVTINPSGESPAAYQVRSAEKVKATVKAADHTAVEDVLQSGLEIKLSLLGSTLQISVRKDT